jgi:regulator of sirC expression with transglutaminase-like and TPR domain
MVYNIYMAVTSFMSEVARSPIDITKAAFIFAKEIAYPALDIARYLERLDQLAASVWINISAVRTPAAQAKALAESLFGQIGFQGNQQNYTDPRNSYLNEVFDRRLGIPISLSVIYMAIADRLGIPAAGIGLPGHFIVKVPAENGPGFIDPFHAGRQLTLDDCARLVEQTVGYSGPLQDEWLEPIPAQAILTRMLNNLRGIYLQEQAWQLAQATVERLQILQPELVELQRDLGVIHHRSGSLRLAAYHYERYLQAAPDAPDAETIRIYMNAAVQRMARLN